MFLILDLIRHKFLTLQSALSHPCIVNQVADCGYYWKEGEKIKYYFTNMEQQTYKLYNAIKGKNRRSCNIDEERSFINSYFVSILKDK